MKSNTPTLTWSEEERAPWNDDWCYPHIFGRRGRGYDEDDDYDEEDDIDDEWWL